MCARTQPGLTEFSANIESLLSLSSQHRGEYRHQSKLMKYNGSDNMENSNYNISYSLEGT